MECYKMSKYVHLLLWAELSLPPHLYVEGLNPNNSKYDCICIKDL